jgi:retron-type reverse transcriptase
MGRLNYSGGHVGIKINDQVGQNFQTKKCLRQGDPLSPLLFNIVVDMLAIPISRAKSEGQFNGVVPHLVDDGLSFLQYADDTIIFLDHDMSNARNFKLLLCTFEQLAGLKINFHKSELFYFREAKEMQDAYSSIFGCQCGSYSFKYLGIPMHYKKNSVIMIGK